MGNLSKLLSKIYIAYRLPITYHSKNYSRSSYCIHQVYLTVLKFDFTEKYHRKKAIAAYDLGVYCYYYFRMIVYCGALHLRKTIIVQIVLVILLHINR